MKSNWMHYLLLGVVSMTAQAADGPVGYTDTPHDSRAEMAGS